MSSSASTIRVPYGRSVAVTAFAIRGSFRIRICFHRFQCILGRALIQRVSLLKLSKQPTFPTSCSNSSRPPKQANILVSQDCTLIFDHRALAKSTVVGERELVVQLAQFFCPTGEATYRNCLRSSKYASHEKASRNLSHSCPLLGCPPGRSVFMQADKCAKRTRTRPRLP